MPKALKEIKHFHSGTVINSSEQDISDDTAAYSLNIDPMSEAGILDGIKNDKLIASSSNNLIKALYPISWGSTSQYGGTDLYNNSRVLFNNIHRLDKNKSIFDFAFFGTKGRKEILKASGIRPWIEKIAISSNLNASYTPASAITATQDTIPYLTETNAITRGVVTSDSYYTISGFTNGTGVIKAVHATVSNYDGGTLTLTSPDGMTKTYIFDDDNDGATGTVDGSGYVRIQLNGLSGQNNVAAQIKAAIENTTNGHGYRISIAVSTDSSTDDTLTLTYTHKSLPAYIAEDDYLILFNDSSNNWAREEVIRIESIDTTNNVLNVTRNVFGSAVLSYSAGTVYDVYLNRLTIDDRQFATSRFIASLSNWSSYAGNHINGNGNWIYYAQSASSSQKESNGLIDSSGTNQSVVFSNSDKTITLGSGVSAPNFTEGDTITIYYGADGEDEPNNGKSFKILKMDTSGSTTILTVDTAPTDDTEVADTIYIESNLIKNHTFHHALDEVNPTVEVGSDQDYKVNHWVARNFSHVSSGESKRTTNAYVDSGNNTYVARVSSGGYWEDTTADHGADNAASYYPFSSNDAYVSIQSFFNDVNTTLSAICYIGDDYINAGNLGSFSVNDIIKIGSEYMKILSMNEGKMYVERGFFNTNEAEHAASTMIDKCVNPLIKQDVSKSRLKSGQSYILTFYAKDLYQSSLYGEGCISISINGGYIDKDGKWIKPSKDSSNGYNGVAENVMYEQRWINFKDLNKTNNDIAYNADGSESTTGLDTTWRKFELIIHIPKNIDLLTDMSIEFSSRGPHDSKIAIDLVDLSENTLILPIYEKATVKSVGSIDNSGKKDLVFFDNKESKLKVIKDFDEDNDNETEIISDNSKSKFTSSQVNSKDGKASFVSKNREVHIGFGSSSEDSPPQWLGYLNHRLFGINTNNELYQDEDTIHKYDNGANVPTMSKIVLAGEHENLVCSLSSDELTINHTAHSMSAGNNIVVREYQDIDNSWDGNGVWVITSTATDSFVCKRIDNKDPDPASNASNNKVSYRPYYYYGIKDGDNHLYRIIPETVYPNVSSASTEYTAGKIESSLPLPYTPTSIATCYNKDTSNGLGGGRVYILTTSGEVKVVNIEIKYNQWTKLSLTTVSTLSFAYKSYKWSNDNVNGNINGDTEVYGGLASESTPSITPSGIPSDIIETKGPNKDFIHSSTNNTDNTLVDFDTRLWIQFRPGDNNNFTSGDRFLFCGLTNSTLIDSNNEIKMADRTPPTNSIFGKTARWSLAYGVKYFNAGPGLIGNIGIESTEDIGDFPVDNLWKHALYYYTREGNDSKINRVYIRNSYTNDVSNFPNYGEVFQSSSEGGTSRGTAQINFGDNVGFDALGGNLPSIKVAKYGLFAMGDNNCDGVIDGTGLVIPSSTTLPDTINNQELGLYGYDNEKVCAHAVGLIGGSESPWIRDFGKFNGHDTLTSNSDYYYRGSEGGAPENMSLEKCLFICSDVHYGDKPFKFSADYGWSSTAFETVNWESIGADSATKITISDTTGLQPGDTVYIDWNGTNGAYTVLKIDSATKFTVGMAYASLVGTAKIWPHTIKPYVNTLIAATSGMNAGINYTPEGGVKDNHFHWAYNPDNPLDSDIFKTKEGGHFSKTWWTPPSSNGLSPNSDEWEKPGMLHRVERLSYRAGYMIKPFDLNDDTFEDLIIGNGTYVDSPVRPENIYHTENGSNTHNNIGGNVNNQFSSKIFITNPVPVGLNSERENKSKIYLCDPMFEYPDILHQLVKTNLTDDSYDTNQWNDTWESFAPLIYGKIDAYVTASANTTNAHRNAANCPLITIDPGADIVDNNSLLGASSVWRDANRFAGQMITVLDSTTGTMQTRYIVASNTESDGTSASHDMYLAVHYPFGHAPAADDYFFIWSHKYACTSPIRLFKEVALDYDFALNGVEIVAYKADPIISSTMYATKDRITSIDGDTALISITTAAIHNLSTGDVIEVTDTTNYNDMGPHLITVTGPKTFTISGTFVDVASESFGYWNLVEPNHSDSSVANPVEFDMPTALVKSSFGGLDMRKSRTLSTTDDDVDASSVAAELEIHSTAHFLNTGDTVTFDGNTSAHDGVYEIIDKTTNDFDVSNPDTNNDTTNAQPITINQWENIVMSTTGGGFLGEIRAGLNAWDTGESLGNVIRKDNSSALKSVKYISSAESSLDVFTTSVGNETNDYFLKNNVYNYKVSLIYDGYQEGLLSTTSWDYVDFNKTRRKLIVKLKLKDFSKRLTAVCLYRRDNSESFYRLVKEIPTSSGWNNNGNIYTYNVEDFGRTQASYESRTGLSESLTTIKLKYGLSTEIDSYLFAGDCSHENIKNASNQIFRSKAGMYSIFDFSTDFIQLKSKPTALVNFAGRLYAFDKTHIYKINQESLAIEDIYEGIGCSSKDSVIVTEYGMFFADSNGAYMHNGTNPIKISSTIESGASSSETWGGTDNINNVSWKTVANNPISQNPYVSFDSTSSSVLFFVNYNKYDSVSSKNKSIYYCWSYNLTKKRWDLWELCEESSIGAPFIGDKGGVFIPIDSGIYHYKGGSTKRDYTWLSKKLTMEEDSVVKVYNKVKINGLTSNLNLNGNNKESSDRLLIKTSSGDVSSPAYSESDNENSQYKLSGSNKKGRWLQFKLEDMTEPIESIGIIYRRKSAK